MVSECVLLEGISDAEGSALFEGFELFSFECDDSILELLSELLRPFDLLFRIHLLVLLLNGQNVLLSFIRGQSAKV